uniref:Uncharacterized protein n=1 Tax=Haptolina brevifila TaxID=156173 RepID=A0A7S2DMQ6_9EUKA
MYGRQAGFVVSSWCVCVCRQFWHKDGEMTAERTRTTQVGKIPPPFAARYQQSAGVPSGSCPGVFVHVPQHVLHIARQPRVAEARNHIPVSDRAHGRDKV